MDPLSIIASTITLLQAGGAVGDGLRKLMSLKNAPATLLQLNNDAAELQLTIAQIGGLPASVYEKELVVVALRKANDTVLQLEKLIEYGLTRPSSKASAIEISRLRWLRAGDKIQQSRSHLQDARLSLCAAAGVMNLASMQTMTVQMEDLSSQVQQLYVLAEEFHRNSQRHLAHLPPAQELQVRNTRAAEPYLARVKNLEALHIAETEEVSADHLTAQEESSPLETMAKTSNVISRFEIGVGLQSRCLKGLCQCKCHKQTRRRTPAYLNHIVGSLLIGYNFFPFVPPSCDLRGCGRRSSTLCVNYTFPRWFLDRTILMEVRNKQSVGPELLLRVIRMRPNYAEIFITCRRGHIGILQRLLNEGQGSISDVGEDGQSLLQIALGFGRDDLVSFLLQEKSSPFQEDNLGMSAYLDFWKHYLTTAKDWPGQRLLFEFDPLELELTDLHTAIIGAGNHPFEETFNGQSRTSVNAIDRLGHTALAYAAGRGNTVAVQRLLQNGADPNLKNLQGYPPLILAVLGRHIQSIHLLYDGGADLNVVDNKGNGLLTVAVYSRCDVEILDYLLEKGLDINARNHNLMTPLCCLISNCYDSEALNMRTLTWLIENGANIEAQDEFGLTPMLHAVLQENSSVLELFLNSGADHAALRKNVLVADRWGDTAMDFAKRRRDNYEDWAYSNVLNNNLDPMTWSAAFKAMLIGIVTLRRGLTAERLELEWGESWDECIENKKEEGGVSDAEPSDFIASIPGAFPAT